MTPSRATFVFAAFTCAVVVTSVPAKVYATPGDVLAVRKISGTTGGLSEPIAAYDAFGWSATALGDLDGDGNVEVAVGAPHVWRDFEARGTVRVLSLNADATVKSDRTIGSGAGGFSGTLALGDRFGAAVASIGDVDDDGVTDLAVGASGDDEAGEDAGAVWILFLNRDGSVKAHRKIGAAEATLSGELVAKGRFGAAVTSLGDLDQNGTPDIAVGSPEADVLGSSYSDGGKVHILFLASDGSVVAQHALANGQAYGRRFGASLSAGDLDGDGDVDLVVGVPGASNSTGFPATGSVVAFLLDASGMVTQSEQLELRYPVEFPLGEKDGLGGGLAALGDIDGDGLAEIAAGAPGFDTDRFISSPGAAFLFYLGACGGWTAALSNELKTLARLEVAPVLDPRDSVGAAFAPLGDIDGDGGLDLLIGAPGDDDGGTNAGALYVASLAGCGNGRIEGTEACDLGIMNGQPRSCCTSACDVTAGAEHCTAYVTNQARVASRESGFDVDLVREERFGTAVAEIGDVDGDGIPDVAVGAPGNAYCDSDYDCGDGSDATGGGSVVILHLNADGTVKSHARIKPGERGFDAPIETYDMFGSALAALGDLDGDGLGDLAVAAIGDDDGATEGTQCDLYVGAIWILFLGPNATVKSYVKLSRTSEAANGMLADVHSVGVALGAPGDIDGDTVSDLVIAEPFANTPGHAQGALRILFLNRSGTIRAQRTIANPDTVNVYYPTSFGASIAGLGDLDGDGSVDLAVGAPRDPDPFNPGGALWILFLDRDASLKSAKKLDGTPGVLPGVNRGPCGDVNADGVVGIRDAQLALQISSDAFSCNLTCCGTRGCCAADACDMNADSQLTAVDALAVLRIAVGLTTSLNCPIQFSIGPHDYFGSSVARLAPNLLAVGALNNQATYLAPGVAASPTCFRPTIWLLELRSDGSVAASTRISQGGEGFGGLLNPGDGFGMSMAPVGDLDHNGTKDLAVGAPEYFRELLDLCNDPSNPRYAPPRYGAVWTLLLDARPLLPVNTP